MMCGFTHVCSDPPVVLGYRTNTHSGLRKKWRVSRHGDDPQQASPSLLLWLMLSTTQVTPVVNCEEHTGRQ